MGDYDLPTVFKFFDLQVVVFPNTFSLELGNEIDHQVRASARSDLRSLNWMRVGWTNPIALRSGYPFA
jgi:hypothetical protein